MTLPRLVPMTVAGIMSGTSADGIDVAIVEITPVRTGLELTLAGHEAVPFAPAVRAAVLAAMDSAHSNGASPITTAEIARLNWRLGLAYADAVRTALDRHPRRLDLIGCHGQTVYHQGTPRRYAGRSFACTLQIGEAAMLARAVGVPVVSNFRPADMALHGQGAPLVPLLDYTFFRHPQRARVLQNLGGIGNLSVIPAGAKVDEVTAFDTGPGNMVIDAAMTELYGRLFDNGGRIASKGQVLDKVLAYILRQPFFHRPPPKSAGREQFGASFTKRFLKMCRSHSDKPEDAIRTATALTAASIRLAVEQFVLAAVTKQPIDFVLSGGGAKNAQLAEEIRTRLEPLGCTVADSGAFGMPVDAKEAMAFALLAYRTWHRRPGNLPSATGADREGILGQITYV